MLQPEETQPNRRKSLCGNSETAGTRTLDLRIKSLPENGQHATAGYKFPRKTRLSIAANRLQTPPRGVFMECWTEKSVVSMPHCLRDALFGMTVSR